MLITSCSRRDHSVCHTSANSILKISGRERCGLSAANGVVGLHSAGEVWYLRLPCCVLLLSQTALKRCHLIFSTSKRFARRFSTPDDISQTTLTLLWPKRATKLDGVRRPFVYPFRAAKFKKWILWSDFVRFSNVYKKILWYDSFP